MVEYKPYLNAKILFTLKTLRDIEILPSHVSVLTALHRAKSATRVELAEDTKLSTQSLTRIGKHLIDTGLVLEGERLLGGRGQPAIRLSIAPAALVGIGLVLEHDRITCVAKDNSGEELTRLRRMGDFNSPDDALSNSFDMLRSTIDQLPETSVLTGIGISQSGFFTSQGSHAVISRNDPERWREIDVRQATQDEFQVDVFHENDASAAAVGLSVQGIGSQMQSFFSVLMAKGIAGGFVSNEKLLRGNLGNAGELGILFGTGRQEREFRPCEESLFGFLKGRWGATPTHEEVELAFAQRSDDLFEWVDRVAEGFSPILSAIVTLLDPEAIIFTGRVPKSLMQEIANSVEFDYPKFANYHAPPPKIIIDPNTKCLETGAASLPLSEFLNGNLFA